MKILEELSRFRMSRYFKLLFVCWDVILLNSAIVLSFLARFGNLDGLWIKEEKTVSLLANLIWIGLLLNKDSYRMIRIERIESILSRTIRKLVMHAFLIAIFVVFLKFTDISRLRLLYFYIFFFGILLISRYISMKLLKEIRSKGYNFKKIIIVGANETGERMQKILAKDLTYGYKFLGFLMIKQKLQSQTIY